MTLVRCHIRLDPEYAAAQNRIPHTLIAKGSYPAFLSIVCNSQDPLKLIIIIGAFSGTSLV